MAQPPITFTPVINLAEHGINANAFRFGVLSMESDRFICVKDTDAAGNSQVVTVDMHQGNTVSTKPMKAEAALMNVQDNIIALKAAAEGGGAGSFLQVFDFDSKSKLGAHTMTESVTYWKWVGPRLLALVTEGAVHHWNLEQPNSTPTLLFSRVGKLAEPGTQIIGYTANSDVSWCLLTGIYSADGNKTISGAMQLYSVGKAQQQMLEGHAGCFGNVVVRDGEAPASLFAFMERKVASPDQTRLHLMDVSGKSQPPFKVNVQVAMPPEAPTDFAIAMAVSEKYGVVFKVTKQGYLYMFDCSSGVTLFRFKISQDPIFLGCPAARTGGILLANRKGQIMNVTVNEQTIVNYVMTNLPHEPNASDIAFGLARRYGLPGAEDMMNQQFARFFAAGDYKGAARIAAQSKALRTSETIAKFQNAPAQPGQAGSPVLTYFSTLLEYGKLSAHESVELVKPAIMQQRKDFVEKWMAEGKLEPSEELGDIVKQLDGRLALQIYLGCQASPKVVESLVQLGQYDQIVQYVRKVQYKADFSFILRNMLMASPEGACTFAKQLLEPMPGVGPLMDINMVVEVFMSQNRLQEATSILLEALKGNLPEQAALQTKLLEMNLLQAPQVAEAIFQMNLFSHYDRRYVAQLCEKAGMTQRALEHYNDAKDVKRVMMSSGGNISPEFLIQYFSNMSPEVCLECLTDLLRHNRSNLQPIVQVATTYHNEIGAAKLIEMFTSFSCWEGMFYFLGGILSSSTDPHVHFTYIQAASQLGHIQEVERVCRESTVYDPVQVKDFLKEAKLQDPRPLIYVCDLHNYVAELAEYLYKNSLLKYIEVYVTKVNAVNTPIVIGTLIDLDCSEDFIKNLLQSVRAQCPVDPLVEEMEARNRLRLLLPWLEGRVAEGNQEPSLHNALAKICIDMNRDPEHFLKTNAFYDSKVVGKYCEDRDPHLAYTAYKRAWGTCDSELVSVTNKNGLYRLQARYLVERQNLDLWQVVLDPEGPDAQHRRAVIDQVVATALPESTDPEEVSCTVKAFINADLPQELIELLEKIVLHSSDFSNNKNLQNLLIVTAIRADKARVMDYINRLDNYDGEEIAKIALGDQYCLYEEAFTIYKKAEQNADAMDVLITNMQSLERAVEFAARVNEITCWYKLGRAQLSASQVSEAIESYLKAENADDYAEVIAAASREEVYEELVKFLKMARNKVKDPTIDSELVYAYAKTNAQANMEEFVSGTNTANVQQIGDRLYEERNFQAAKVLYSSIPNHAKLASCHVHLAEYTAAVEAAKKANNPKTWKEVNLACVAAQEFRCAQIAGVQIIVHPDHLEELIMQYEKHGFFDELIALLDSGLSDNRAHIGMYTELGILYAKYKSDKLMDFIKLNVSGSKLNIPKLIRACERHYHWAEAVFLYVHYDEFDSAANAIMAHSGTAFVHEQFLTVMQKVSNLDLYYRAITFYLEEQPMQISGLLQTLIPKIDHARAVQQLRKAGHLALILPYLKQVQNLNLAAVNEAINDVYVEAEDYENLRTSVTDFDAFDQLALAQRMEKHELLEMRRIAVFLFKKNKRYKQAMDLSKNDKMYSDAMQTARESESAECVEQLLRYFVEAGDQECFAACLYVCYDLVQPDIVLELAWRANMMDFCMPYLIQVVKEYCGRVDALDKKTTQAEEEKEKEKSAPNDFVADYVMPFAGGNLGGMGHAALMPPAPMGMQQGMGMQQPMGMGQMNMGGYGM
jgi:clathrin heavy chain